MNLTGLHLLLTYQCTHECDHCFVWGSPRQSGTMTLTDIREILAQARELGTVKWIYFEGGEPFLYFPILADGVREASQAGFRVGIVSNAYWAADERDALEWLRPLAGFVDDFSVSRDLFHERAGSGDKAAHASRVAVRLGMPTSVLTVAQPESRGAASSRGQLPAGESAVMFRGRAAETLTGKVKGKAWTTFKECPHEDFEEPGRLHVDAFGNLQICQGIVLGNLFEKPLVEIMRDYDPRLHPVAGPMLAGGPAGLAHHHRTRPAAKYADACHLCYATRKKLMKKFPEAVGPANVFGVAENGG